MINLTQQMAGLIKKTAPAGCRFFMLQRSFYKNWIMISPIMIAVMVDTSPGIINEWLRIYLPILVVPVRSKFMAATSVG